MFQSDLLKNIQSIDIKDYSYELPEERIAKYPLPQRDQSKLLIYKNGHIQDEFFNNLVNHLPKDALLVFNNTKVIHARLLFQRESGAKIEIFCLEPDNQVDYQIAFGDNKTSTWKCLVGNAKRWKNDLLHKEINTPKGKVILTAALKHKSSDYNMIAFSWDNESLVFAEVLHFAGVLPLPPYLNREADNDDENRYQTVYAKHQGSVAAPTAGLHFTEEIITQLQKAQFGMANVTLHVGAGTFKPIKSEKLETHEMHQEFVNVTKETIIQILQKIKSHHPIVAVGTTSVRTLESLYWYGVQIIEKKAKPYMQISQWIPYETHEEIPAWQSMEAILTYMQNEQLDTISGDTQIIIAPGYTFKLVDALITNFHQPENTLILLIAACVGDDWRKIYKHALNNQYRFLSYGDSSLLHLVKN